ncbi:unnamed protein product [Auanema sp. JU1783]|nr:unnamed protein product [Auanema sp. JU1783]
MANEFGDFFRSIPLITRHWFAASIIFPLLGRIGLLPAQWMYLDWNLIAYKFQFWRPITSLVYYPLSPQTGFHWLIMIYFLYQYSKSLEEGTYAGRPADYLFMLLVNWIVCTGLCLALGSYFMLEPMVISVLYVWCQLNKETIVSFWFGTRFKALYLPWVLCGVNAVLRGSGFVELLGILIGHTYYFLAFKYPEDHDGAQLISTPSFLVDMLPHQVGGVHGMAGAQPEARRAPAQPRRHAWGEGRPLGQ